MNVRVRYKDPDAGHSQLVSVAVRDATGGLTPNLGFAAAVAEFGMLLRNAELKGQATWASAQELARTFKGDDPGGYRGDFIRLLDLAAALASQQTTAPDADSRWRDR
jgi:Ca-activated chloride channel family protein